MQVLKNQILQSKHERKFLLDAFYKATKTKKAVVIFVHGFKGFKDWGHWNLFCENFANQNIIAIKFNFSHNGTTIENPLDFDDLEAFGNNNFCTELDDLETVLNWLENQTEIDKAEIDFENINLIGHSRAGGIVLRKALEDNRINKICTLAAVSNYEEKWTKEVVEHWKKEKTVYILNGRTKQKMPLHFQLCENYFENRERLNIESNCKKLENKVLIIHGTEDTAVDFKAAKDLESWIKNAELLKIENANHVFGGTHPFEKKELPGHTQIAVKKITDFFKP